MKIKKVTRFRCGDKYFDTKKEAQKFVNQPEFKVFEGGNIKEELKNALIWCKQTGGHIATLKEIYDLKKNGLIKNQWYTTGTIYLNGEIRTATLKELTNIEKLYKNGGHVLFLYINYSGLYGNDNLLIYGRYLGVAPRIQKKAIKR